MERGREGRRGGSGGGAVSAPRRPRTIGFKDASVGEDGDDMVDDVHNQRLRERPKKESSSLHSVQGIPLSSLASVSRCKRKRQGSQEVHDQARSSTVDDIDETTEDTEIDVSDDDDDPPPPPIPRRSIKFRPQGKFLEDGLSADLPAVPRKARTAILKRPQEASSVSVIEASSHQGSAIHRAAPPPSVPSSSSVVTLKPGRRTKPMSSKPRASKVSKMSTQTVISEQEVEVAEALFDLARMFTNQPILASHEASVDKMYSSKPDMEPNSEPEVKFEPNSLANFTVAPSSLPPQSSASSVPESTAVLCVTSSQLSTNLPPAISMCSPTMSTALPPAAAILADSAVTVTSPKPLPSPPPSIVVPPAEAPKRKRPRFKTRSDEAGLVSQVPPHGIGAVACSSSVFASPSPRLQSEQVLKSVPYPTDDTVLEISTRTSATPILAPASIIPPCIPTALDLPTLCTPVLVQRYNSTERRSGSAEKVTNVEASNSAAPLKKHETPTPDQKRAPALGCGSPLALSAQEMEPTLDSGSGIVSLTSLELGKRSVPHPGSASDEVGTKKLENNLKVPPLVKHALPSERDNKKLSGSTAHNVQEKGPIGLTPAPPAEDLLIDKECEKETHREHEQRDRECGERPVAENERGREPEGERQKKGSEEDNGEELPTDRKMEKEWEKVEFCEQPPEQKPMNVLMSDSRIQNLDRLASADTTSTASSCLLSAPLGVTSVATNLSSSIATLPISVGTASWPLGLPPVGYYSSGAAAAASVSWPGGGPVSGLASVDEHIPPAVQLQHPYLIQARQPQPWKRCASHVYIAHFIDAQQQMNRHPFIQAAYQNSASFFGAKSYNLNIPLTPAQALFGSGSGGPLIGSVSGATAEGVASGVGSRNVPGNDRNLGAISATTNALTKDRGYIEALSRKQVVQQLQQPLQISQNPSLQARPAFGFPVAQVGPAGGVATGVVNGGGTLALGDPESGGGSALVGLSSGPTSGSTTVAGLGTGAGNGGVVSHATAQAQYLQAVMQQGAFPFPFQAAAHFGPGFSGPGHQQAAQYFSSPFYATHLVHTATHTQQQMQKSTNASAGLVSNDLPHPQQQLARNLPPTTSQQQQQSVPPSASPSRSQQLHTQVSISQQMQRSVEREVNNASEGNSTNESKFPSQRNVLTQGSSNVTPAVNQPSSMLVGGSAGMHCLQPQDFNLLPGLAANPVNQLHQNQMTSQHLSPLQQQHHVSTGAAIQISLKGTDQQSSHKFSAMPVVAMTRASTIGPGPLGLAPVAPVMAPQGHAMLQSVTDSGRGPGQHHQSHHHQAISGQSHQLPLPSSQQQQRAGQLQRGVTAGTSIEDGRAIVEGNPYSNRSGRDTTEDRKVPSKRGNGSALNLARADLDSSASIQGSPSGGLPGTRMSSNAGAALNLLTTTSAVLISRSSGHSTGSILQQTVPSVPLTQNSKQAMPRSKLLAGSGSVNSGTSSPTQLPSFSDRTLLGSSVSNKVSGPALSLQGQSLAQGSQVPRQCQGTQQHTQLKLSNRGSLGSLPTPTGTAPQAVLAAAIAKSQQGVQQQQLRPQTQAGANTGPLPRLPAGNVGVLPTSSSIPLRPLSPAAKSLSTGAAKNNMPSKGSFPVSQRPASVVSGKRSTPPSGPNVTSILGPSSIIQTPSTKAQQQQSQSQPQSNANQLHTQAAQQPPQSLQQPPPQNLTPGHQYHHQQAHVNSQQLHQMHNQQSLTQQQQSHHMQRQLFLQNPTFQQHQHAAGPQLSSHPQQQAGLRQQSQQQSSQVQTHQQINSSSSQLQPQQHHSSPQLHLQQQSMQQQQQHGLQGGPGSFSVGIPSGNLNLGSPVLTLGTGSNGKIDNSSWIPGADGVAPSQCSVARSNPSTSKAAGSSVPTLPGSSQSGAPPFLHAQFSSGAVSGQQQSSSPRSSSGTQYLQPVANSGGSGIAVDENGMSSGVARKAESSSQPKF